MVARRSSKASNDSGVAFRTTFYESIEALQADLDAWLVHDNAERPHLGYRNHGRRPLDTVNDYLASLREKSVA